MSECAALLVVARLTEPECVSSSRPSARRLLSQSSELGNGTVVIETRLTEE